MMRFIFLFFLILPFISRTGHALSPEFANTTFSPSFGLMLTDFSIGGAGVGYKTTPEVGFYLGVNCYIPSESDFVDYITGLSYWSSRTSIESNSVQGSTFVEQETLIEVNRLSLPVVAKVFPFRKDVGLYSKIGIINHFLLNLNQTTEVRSNNGTGQETQNFFSDESSYEPYFVDGMAGIGFQTTLGNSFGFFIELNYLYGLTPIVKGNNEVRTASYQTSFGIGF